jgi:chaperonin cofactor prefoldin
MKIKGKEYELKFNFSVYERLEELWGCNDMIETMQKATDLQKGKVKLSDVRKMLEASLMHTELTHEEIVEHLNSLDQTVADIVGDLIKAMAKASVKEEKEPKKKT